MRPNELHRERFEGRVPPGAAFGRVTYDPRPIIEMLLGVSAEVLERRFVGIEEAVERFVQTGHIHTTPRIAQRQH